MPGAPRHYKKLLAFFPPAISVMQLRPPLDLIISSDARVIKGVRGPEGVPHICYCHSPPRYLWDLQEDYQQSAEVGGPLGRALFTRLVPYVREFDRQSSRRVTHFIANSRFVRERIKACYGRDSIVIHPPVDLKEYHPSDQKAEDFYLVVSQLVPYKRIDLAVAAFNRLGKKLVIIGEGSERSRLEAMAGPTITFLGSQSQPVLRDHYQRCRALVFPGIEDFGITPLEAQASGRPVIAFGRGGALETIQENSTGLFFREQTVEHLIEAVEKPEAHVDFFQPEDCRANAERFAAVHFRARLSAYVSQVLAGEELRPSEPWPGWTGLTLTGPRSPGRNRPSPPAIRAGGSRDSCPAGAARAVREDSPRLAPERGSRRERRLASGPVAHGVQDGPQRFAERGQGIFNFRRDLTKDFSLDDLVSLQFAQLLGQHLRARAGNQAAKFSRPERSLPQVKQDNGFPLPAHDPQGPDNRTLVMVHNQ